MTKAFALPLVASLVVVTGCDGPVPSSLAPSPYDRALAIAGSGEISQILAYGTNAMLAEYARQIPGFAGLHMVGDTLVVSGTDLAALEPRLADLGRHFEAPHVVTRKVERSFMELAAVADAVLGRPGADRLTLMDIDERENVVRIGYDPATPADRDGLLALVRDAGVPNEAVVTEATSPLVTARSLRDRFRPLLGGIETEAGYGECTSWTIAGDNWERAIITAAHCTGQVGQDNDDVFFQPDSTYGAGANRVGEESWDPAFQNYDSPEIDCRPWMNHCRLSDVALISMDDTVTAKRGHFARPIERVRWRGSVDVSSYVSQALEVTQKYTSTIPGVILEKIGRTTGWTYGDVFETCALRPSNHGHNLAQFWVLCADGVHMGGYRGDSGAPVFRVTGSTTVAAYGVVFSIDPDYTGSNQYGTYSKRTYYSPFGAIGDEFPGATMWPLAVKVDIDGPTQINAGEEAQWSAEPTGGYAPYTYRWYKNGQLVGTGSTYSTSSPWDFDLRVEMEDGHDWFDAHEMTIFVDGGLGGGGS